LTSQARLELETRLRDVDELISAHGALTGGTPGRPKERQGAAVTRAGVVLLAAATEAFVEDLFEESARLLWPKAGKRQLDDLFEKTTRRLNNANVANTQLLLFNLGLPWALDRVRWQNFPNATFKKSLDGLISARNKIAHGEQPGVRLGQLRRWRRMVAHYGERLERLLGEHIETVVGKAPSW